MKTIAPLRKVVKVHPVYGFGYYCTVDLECGHSVAWPANQVSAARAKVRCKKCPEEPTRG